MALIISEHLLGLCPRNNYQEGCLFLNSLDAYDAIITQINVPISVGKLNPGQTWADNYS